MHNRLTSIERLMSDMLNFKLGIDVLFCFINISSKMDIMVNK